MENNELPQSCYDCEKSNSCEVYAKNDARIKPLALLDKRLKGCPREDKTKMMEG